jgi:hypothetical protein
MSIVGAGEVQAGTAAGVSPDSDGTPATAGGGIDRLNAFDGLFLRAEHLTRMQDYARDLSLAVGAAGGPGVVHGFDVTLGDRDGTIRITPGLALNEAGRPLASNREIVLSLSDLKPGPNTFWYVRLQPKEWLYGNEAVQGLRCDEPCSNGATGRPYGAEGVEVTLVEATEPGLSVWSTQGKRSRLASRLFAAEAVDAKAWSRTLGDAGADLAGRTWRPPIRSGADAHVDLAVLIPEADLTKWQVDVWAARRDRGDPPPARDWQWRLGMRPWSVFVAQILQFQDALGHLATEGVTATVAATLGTFADPRVPKRLLVEKALQLKEEIETGRSAEHPRIALARTSLPEMGLDELPPTGFLQYSGSLDGIEGELEYRLGHGVELRVCTCRPVDVALAVAEAQHRDRIRLDADPPASVDILVPVTGDGSTVAFDWVAFVRRDETYCVTPPEEQWTPTEDVAVHVVDTNDDPEAFTRARRQMENGEIPKASSDPVTLSYPIGTWAVPEDEDYESLYAELKHLAERRSVMVAALVRTDGRQPVGAVRAELLATLLRSNGDPTPASLRTVVTGPERGEAIVVLVGNAG